jgi:hypothetical protein
MEQILIRKIKGGIFGIKTGTKTPEQIASLLNKLKQINPGMYEELFLDYKKIIKE